jgi:hypothetical protein
MFFFTSHILGTDKYYNMNYTDILLDEENS